jgi:hypothetical protein
VTEEINSRKRTQGTQRSEGKEKDVTEDHKGHEDEI